MPCVGFGRIFRRGMGIAPSFTGPRTSAPKNSPTRTSSTRPMPSSGFPRPAFAARISGPWTNAAPSRCCLGRRIAIPRTLWVTLALQDRPQLPKGDRSLITCAALVALGRTEQMSFHFPRAIENGVTKAEIVEMVTHPAFYAGWPNAMPAIGRAKELLGQKRPRAAIGGGGSSEALQFLETRIFGLLLFSSFSLCVELTSFPAPENDSAPSPLLTSGHFGPQLVRGVSSKSPQRKIHALILV
jgi:alkylhydroperoxidase/carboxymuconolactone decarboxylase family protein YurZ